MSDAGKPLASLLALALCASTSTAAAVQQHGSHQRSGLEASSGAPLRLHRLGTSQVPAPRAMAWERFRADAGGSWLADWDEITGAPNRIWGSGVTAVGAQASPAAAEAFARAMLARHLDLLAPGASTNDFELVSNVTTHGSSGGLDRTVAFLQQHGGMPVIGGQLSFRFKNDRLFVIASQALPHVHASAPGTLVSDAAAAKSASQWIASDVPGAITVTAISDAMVLPLVGRSLSYPVVRHVEVSTSAPATRWNVYVDARTGQPVAREQTLHFAEASLLFNVPVRQPLSERLDFAASNTNVLIDSQTVTTDALGTFAIPDATTSITVLLEGASARIKNESGETLSYTLDVDPTSTVVWSEAEDEHADAQLNAYIHAGLAQSYARTIAPELGWLTQTLPVNVNIDDNCNAFYDGQSINFFTSGGGCANTGQLADVVYHEFGHGFHHRAVIQGSGSFDSALSEGLSDFFSTTITDDPAMGRGFFFTQAPLRHVDPVGELKWPDDIHSDPHQTGLIIAGALWDLRKLLNEKYGAEEGVPLTEQLFYQAMRNANDIPSMYVEVLAADDDDGNLDNGTPNVCEIIDAFGRHGLRTLTITAPELSVEPPEQNGHDVVVSVEGLYEQCDNDRIDNATIEWSLERLPAQTETLTMEGGPALFNGQIPIQKTGEVVQFRVELELSAGSSIRFPDNFADPLYEFFVGEVTPIYCTDFESNPEIDGWTHGLAEGQDDEGADDWMWGPAGQAPASGDPNAAYSGTYVFGNDLGGGSFNGLYQGNKVNYAVSPLIEVGDANNVRIQYRRWLNVEDGFFDRAGIYVNDKDVWSNFASNDMDNATVHHRDREWRFHDIDISAQVENGAVSVKFELDTDQGLHLGGWTIDDFCVVTYDGPVPASPVCGNGFLEAPETCDDGNLEAGDGCSPFCAPELGDETTDESGPADDIVAVHGCGCRVVASKRSTSLAWLALLAPLALVRRRRA